MTPKMNINKKYTYIIGIDPGVKTGFASWNVKDNSFEFICSLPIHEVIIILNYRDNKQSFIRVEDARKRKWFGGSGREKLQGAGSIKRDSKIWEDYLKYKGFDYEMVAPKNNKTKLNTDLFSKITGWEKPTNEHSRDAAMLCFKF